MTVSDTIDIDASPDVVWAITQDVERWPEWTPTVTSVKLLSPDPIGRGSVARIKQPMQPESDWVVTEFSKGKRFAWRTQRTGIEMTGTHEIFPNANGTRNVLRVDASGFLAALLWPLLRPAIRKALSDENHGLKTRSEQRASNPAPTS